MKTLHKILFLSTAIILLFASCKPRTRQAAITNTEEARSAVGNLLESQAQADDSAS